MHVLAHMASWPVYIDQDAHDHELPWDSKDRKQPALLQLTNLSRIGSVSQQIKLTNNEHQPVSTAARLPVLYLSIPLLHELPRQEVEGVSHLHGGLHRRRLRTAGRRCCCYRRGRQVAPSG